MTNIRPILPRRERRARCRAGGDPWQPWAILPDGNIVALPRPPDLPMRPPPMGVAEYLASAIRVARKKHPND